MTVINAYELVSQGNDINTKMFRYAVISSVFSADIPREVTVNKLSDETLRLIRKEEHSEVCDRVLFLFGAGVLSENAVSALIKKSNSNLPDIIKAENTVIEDENKNEEDRLSYEIIEKILLCCSFSKKHAEIQSADFEEVRRLAGLPHITLIDGMVKLNDIEFLKFLVSVGEKFGTIDNDGTISVEEVAENIINSEEIREDNIESEYYPFAVNIRNLIHYSAVYYEYYGKDYITFANQNGLQIDNKFESRYEEYVRKIKLHFSVKSYTRKRGICGDKVNWFDYAVFSDGNISDKLNADYVKEIDLEISENYPKEELIKKAVGRFKTDLTISDNSVIEIYHENDKALYLLKNSELKPLDNKQFHTLLFDFNKIWSIIQMCSRNHQIKAFEDKITIPDELLNEIAPNEQEYAERLIKEQYQRMMDKRKSNKIIQTLSDIRAAAEAERENINLQEAAKQQEQQKMKDKKSNRGASTEG